MSSYPFAAVLFDMDGVVIASTALHHQVWDDFLRRHGLESGPAAVRRADGRKAVEFIAETFPGPLTPADLERLTAEREELYRQRLCTAELRPVPGVLEFLAALRSLGVPRVLATSAVPANAELALRRLHIDREFDAYLTAADVRHGKPDPEVYLKAAPAVGIAPERCLVAEDAVAGVAAARAAGARCLGLTTTAPAGELWAAGADYVCADFASLPPEVRPSGGTG